MKEQKPLTKEKIVEVQKLQKRYKKMLKRGRCKLCGHPKK